MDRDSGRSSGFNLYRSGFSPFYSERDTNKKAENQAEDYIEKEKGHLNLGPEGWSMGEKEVR
jgi:hypothetical protein